MILYNTKQQEVTGAAIYKGKFLIKMCSWNFSIWFPLAVFHETSSTLDDQKMYV